MELSTSGKDYLLKLETRERERTKISSLKIRYNKVFGYYIEVTNSNKHLVPADYIRKQTTVGAERYITPELKEYEEKVLTAEEKRLRAGAPPLRGAAGPGGGRGADASARRPRRWPPVTRCCPSPGAPRSTATRGQWWMTRTCSSITAGRHPVVERVLAAGDSFVPNDVRMDATDSQLLIITGPNMAGKSTVMRQVALTVLMAQAGSLRPGQGGAPGAV